MTPVHLGFRAFDVHELLCHGLAEAAGLYRQAGLSVTLLDTTFLPDEALPENTFHAACGGALASFLKGEGRKVVFIACDRPMFWLYGRPGIDSISQLAQARVATFPDGSPPAELLRKLLQDAGVSPGLLPARDDNARLPLVISGSVDAGLLSSLFLPHEVEARGARKLAFVGENLRLPSAGLAVSSEFFDEQPQLVASVVGVYREALRKVFDADQGLLREVLAGTFRHSREGLDQAVEIVRACYNPLGYSDESLLQSVIDVTAAGLGLASRPARELYALDTVKSCDRAGK